MRNSLQVLWCLLLSAACLYYGSLYVRCGYPTSFDDIPRVMKLFSDRISRDFGCGPRGGVAGSVEARPEAAGVPPSVDILSSGPIGVGGYWIRLPKGYRAAERPDLVGLRGKDFVMFANSELTAERTAAIAILILPIPPDDITDNPLDAAVSVSMADRKQRLSWGTVGAPRPLHINSIPFRRFEWSGVSPPEGDSRGVVYVGLDRRKLICVQIQAKEHDGAKELIRVAEGSVRTLRR